MRKGMEKRMMNLLLEFIRDSKRSDRELAKILGVSQPTVTRMRSRLVKEGVIKEFTIIPDFAKMGYEIMAISCVRKKEAITEPAEKLIEWTRKHPNIIFAARAEGMGKNGVIISLHKSFTDFYNFVVEALRYWGEDIQDYDTMLIGLKGIIAKPLSLRYLAEEKSSED